MKQYDKLYAEIGKITIEFETMNLIIRNIVKRIKKHDKNGNMKIENMGYEQLYIKFKEDLKEAYSKLDYFEELYNRLESLRKKRNDIIHSHCMIGNVLITSYNFGNVVRLKKSDPTASFKNFRTGISFKYTYNELVQLRDDCKALTSEILKLDEIKIINKKGQN